MLSRLKSCGTAVRDALSAAWNNKGRVLKLAILAALAYLILVPLLQPILVGIWFWMPALLTAAVGGYITWRMTKRNTAKALAANKPARSLRYLAGPGTAGLLTVLLTGWFVVANTSSIIVDAELAAAVDEEELEDMPETMQTRLLPRTTAEEYAKNSTHDNRLAAGEAHIVRVEENGKSQVWWQVPRQYTVWYGRLFGSVGEVVRIDAGASSMKVDEDAGKDAFFLFGGHSWTVETLFRLRHPFSERGETVYWRDADGSWLILVSHVKYVPTKLGTMVPKLGGVMSVNKYGWTKNYSVKEAAQRFPGAALFPPEITRKYAKAYATYHRGISNAYFTQKDLYEISEDEGGINKFPYFQDMKKFGLQEVVVFEPIGPSFAFTKLLMFDAVNGRVRAYTPKGNLNINGPRKAVSNVRNADPDADWSNYLAIEPRIVNSPRGKYWLFTVVNNAAGHNFVMYVVVDVVSLDAVAFKNTQEMQASKALQLFLEGKLEAPKKH